MLEAQHIELESKVFFRGLQMESEWSEEGGVATTLSASVFLSLKLEDATSRLTKHAAQ